MGDTDERDASNTLTADWEFGRSEPDPTEGESGSLDGSDSRRADVGISNSEDIVDARVAFVAAIRGDQSGQLVAVAPFGV